MSLGTSGYLGVSFRQTDVSQMRMDQELKS
jgi:hypothetical protein